jgi:hypothetical protein
LSTKVLELIDTQHVLGGIAECSQL